MKKYVLVTALALVLSVSAVIPAQATVAECQHLRSLASHVRDLIANAADRAEAQRIQNRYNNALANACQPAREANADLAPHATTRR